MSFANRLINFEFNSAIARKVLGLYYKPGRFYRVPFGPIAGEQLEFASEINFHMMLGLWETRQYRKTLAVLDKLDKHRPVTAIVDIGANIGYCTLVFSGRFPDAAVYAFECSHDTAARLRRNLDRNNKTNVQLIEKAVTDSVGQVKFFIGHHHTSSIHQEWAHTPDSGVQTGMETVVPSISLDAFFANTPDDQLPQFVKIDIEGGGTLALPGMREFVRRAQPLILIESHTPDEDNAISDLVLSTDYSAFRIDEEKMVRSPEKIYPDKAGIWGTLLLGPKDLLPELV